MPEGRKYLAFSCSDIGRLEITNGINGSSLSTEKSSMNTSQVIIQYLAAAGIRHIFGYPGDPSVEFLEAARREGMRFVLGSREGTAGLMAEAYGQLTGRPGVCLSTLGPGATNLVNAVANAYLDRVPMLAISGQIERKREPYFTHQVVDHNRLFSPISKWTVAVQPDTVGTVMRKALRIACAERPGPVHLTTAADVVGAEASDDEIKLPPMRMLRTPQMFSVGAAEADPVKLLQSARRPVILAGISAVWSGASAALVHLAETIGAPVVVTPMAKGVMPEDHPYYAGKLDMACNKFIWDFLKGADLLLAVGFDAVELIKPWPLAATVIHIDTVPNTDQIYRSDLEIVGDIAHILGSNCRGKRQPRALERGRDRRASGKAAGALLRRKGARASESDGCDERGARANAARHRSIRRRRLAQALGRAGLDDLCAAHAVDEQRSFLDGVFAARRHCRQAGASGQAGRLLHRRRRSRHGPR